MTVASFARSGLSATAASVLAVQVPPVPLAGTHAWMRAADWLCTLLS